MDRRSFRILHLASSERWTGVADPVVSLARQQQELGHEVWLACVPGRSFERRARRRGVRVINYFYLDRRLHPVHIARDIARIRRFVVENRIEIVHSHLLNDNWLSAVAIAGLRQPLLLVRTFHRWEPPRRDPLHKWLFGRRNDLAIATSRSLLHLFDNRIALAPGRAKVVYGGVDYDYFNPSVSGEAIRREFDLSPETPVAGIVARLTEGRGHNWLLEAAPEVARRLPRARILIVGRGPLKRPLRARIASSPLRETVIMTGYRKDDLRETYAALDAALFLGMGSEGTCRAALEAMATGRPVIATRSAALPEIIEDGRTGLLVKPADPRALADAIVRLLGDRDLCRRMGEAARQAVIERFSERRRAEETLEAYRAAWEAKFGGP